MTDNQQNEGASVEQTEVNPDLPKFHISLEMKRSDGNYGSMAVTLGASNVTEENIEATLAGDRKSTRLNSSHSQQSRMPSSA